MCIWNLYLTSSPGDFNVLLKFENHFRKRIFENKKLGNVVNLDGFFSANVYQRGEIIFSSVIFNENKHHFNQ